MVERGKGVERHRERACFLGGGATSAVSSRASHYSKIDGFSCYIINALPSRHLQFVLPVLPMPPWSLRLLFNDLVRGFDVAMGGDDDSGLTSRVDHSPDQKCPDWIYPGGGACGCVCGLDKINSSS